MGATRLPGKVLRPIAGTPLIGLLLQRLARSRRIGQIVLATSTDPRNAALVEYVRGLGYEVHQGSEQDVLDRYYRAAQAAGADVIVRITGDCPLIDPELVDAVIGKYLESGADYASNTQPPSFPDGLDTEVFSFAALEEAARAARQPAQREHVTPYLREAPQFRRVNLAYANDGPLTNRRILKSWRGSSAISCRAPTSPGSR